MWPNLTRIKFLLIAIGLSCVMVSQLYATFLESDNDDFIGSWDWDVIYSDLKITGHDIYQTEFDEGSFIGTAVISGSNKINAIHQLSKEKFVLSTYSKVTVGGVKYQSGDLIEYNFYTGQSSLYFSGDLFSKKENIDAVYIRDNGNIVLSTKGDAELGGISFKREDVIEYNPFTSKSTVLLNGGVFGGKGNIDALHILDDGDILFSIAQSGKFEDLKIGDEDVFWFDVQSGTTSLLADFEKNSHSHNIDGFTIAVPEPATAILLSAGALMLIRKRSHKI